MGSALCGGGEVWPPLPPEMEAAHQEWIDAGRPGLAEAQAVVETEREEHEREGRG